MKNHLRDSSGLIMVEAIMLIVGVILPILLTTTAIINILYQQSSLSLLTRQATRSFALANDNQTGLARLSELATKQIRFDNPVDLKLSCLAQCMPGTHFEVSGKVKSNLIAIPFLPDLEITLRSKAVAILDRFVQR